MKNLSTLSPKDFQREIEKLRAAAVRRLRELPLSVSVAKA